MQESLKRFFNSIFVPLIAICFSNAADAKEVSYLARSPKALLMGDAYTGLARGAYTLFYNPAALANHSGFSLTPLNPAITLPNILKDSEKFQDLPDDPDLLAQQFSNFPVHVGASIVPGFKIGNFGFSGIINNRASMLISNNARTFIDIDYRYDRGFAFGYGAPVIRSGDLTFNIGIGAKYLEREALVSSYPVFGTRVLDLLTGGIDDVRDVARGLGLSNGSGWGLDLGTEVVFGPKNSQFIFSTAVLDLGGTEFESDLGEVPDQEMVVSAGLAYRLNLSLFALNLSADLHPLNQDIEFSRKLHLGAELELPVIKAFAGLNGGELSYGLGADVLFFEVYGGFFGIPVGNSFVDLTSNRAAIYVNIFNFSFDA